MWITIFIEIELNSGYLITSSYAMRYLYLVIDYELQENLNIDYINSRWDVRLFFGNIM